MILRVVLISANAEQCARTAEVPTTPTDTRSWSMGFARDPRLAHAHARHRSPFERRHGRPGTNTYAQTGILDRVPPS